MFVPSYVPPPIEISDSVAEAPYNVRVKFIRRVVRYFTFSLLISFSVSFLPMVQIPISVPLSATFGILILLNVVRNIGKGRRFEVVISAGLLLPLLIALGITLRCLSEAGYPTWPIGGSLVSVLLYSQLCGRDLSFMGMFLLPFLASVLVWLVGAFTQTIGSWHPAIGISLSAIVLLYFVYDLAALLTRRRIGETPGAVCDLFRDTLNFTTYWLQVYWHWRKYPLWQR